MMTEHFANIGHKYNVQEEISELESSNGSHETCMIEIEMGRRGRWEARANKEGKQEDCNREGIQQYDTHSPKSSPRRETRTRERSQGPIGPRSGTVWILGESKRLKSKTAWGA